MQRDLAYRPYEGRRRVCIIAAADRMAPNMSNILLKTLEEPPLHTVIILLANNRRLILPTILSRCQTVRFQSIACSSGHPMAGRTERLSRRRGPSPCFPLGRQPGKGPGPSGGDRGDSKGDLLKGWLGDNALFRSHGGLDGILAFGSGRLCLRSRSGQDASEGSGHREDAEGSFKTDPFRSPGGDGSDRSARWDFLLF